MIIQCSMIGIIAWLVHICCIIQDMKKENNIEWTAEWCSA